MNSIIGIGTILFLIILVIVVLILISCVKIVHQAQAVVVERLGAYLTTWNTGLHFKLPIIDRVARRIDLKEQVVDFPPQPVITKDNVTMQIDTVIFYSITDPKMFCYGVASPIVAIENLTATTLRNIIGDLELDQTLTSRETINTKMRSELDLATDPWGIKVNRVELKNIIPPTAIRDAMEKQMKAERERREAILRAEGEKKSTVLVAEGQKESVILEAEAAKQAAILKAEAEKEKMIREAEGEAEAIMKVQQATADGLRFLKDAGADNAVLTLRSLRHSKKPPTAKLPRSLSLQKYRGSQGSSNPSRRWQLTMRINRCNIRLSKNGMRHLPHPVFAIGTFFFINSILRFHSPEVLAVPSCSRSRFPPHRPYWLYSPAGEYIPGSPH